MSKSIATKLGDGGQTGLVGGTRVSKSGLRVEAYGTVDELNSLLGFARSICQQTEIVNTTKQIQKELFRVGSALATPTETETRAQAVTEQMVEALTAEVHNIEAIDGVLSDWSLPGEHSASAAYDVARTVCRRAERNVVRLIESGDSIDSLILPYLNRLSDLLWLFGRLIELTAGVNAQLREPGHEGPRWSRAWS